MSDFERKLAKDLSRGKEYRETYAEAFASEYTATQIQLQRKQRGWTQDELGRRIGSNQGRISIYEDEDYGKWSLDTLRKLASEFGLWLKVSFEAYSTLIHEVGHFAPANLVRSSFEQDAELRQWLEEDTPGKPEAKLRRMVERWAAAPEPDLNLLATWLQGFSLPGFNEREWTPAQYLLDTIPESDEKVWTRLAGGLASILRRDEEEYAALLRSPATFRDNLFALGRSIGPLPVIQDGLQAVYDRAMRRFEHTGMTGLGYEGDTGLLDAMIHNQADDRWKPIWFAYLRGRNHPEDFTEPGHSFLPGAWVSGMRGLLGLPKRENDYWLDIATGIGDLERRFLLYGKGAVGSEPNVLDEVERAVAVVYDWWGQPSAAQNLMRASVDLMKTGGAGWSMHALAAWAYGVHQRAGWAEAVFTGGDIEQRTFANSIAGGLQWYRGWQEVRHRAPRGPEVTPEHIESFSKKVIPIRRVV